MGRIFFVQRRTKKNYIHAVFHLKKKKKNFSIKYFADSHMHLLLLLDASYILEKVTKNAILLSSFDGNYFDNSIYTKR